MRSHILHHLQPGPLRHSLPPGRSADRMFQIVRMERLFHAAGIPCVIGFDVIGDSGTDGFFISRCYCKTTEDKGTADETGRNDREFFRCEPGHDASPWIEQPRDPVLQVTCRLNQGWSE